MEPGVSKGIQRLSRASAEIAEASLSQDEGFIVYEVVSTTRFSRRRWLSRLTTCLKPLSNNHDCHNVYYDLAMVMLFGRARSLHGVQANARLEAWRAEDDVAAFACATAARCAVEGKAFELRIEVTPSSHAAPLLKHLVPLQGSETGLALVQSCLIGPAHSDASTALPHSSVPEATNFRPAVIIRGLLAFPPRLPLAPLPSQPSHTSSSKDSQSHDFDPAVLHAEIQCQSAIFAPGACNGPCRASVLSSVPAPLSAAAVRLSPRQPPSSGYEGHLPDCGQGLRPLMSPSALALALLTGENAGRSGGSWLGCRTGSSTKVEAAEEQQQGLNEEAGVCRVGEGGEVPGGGATEETGFEVQECISAVALEATLAGITVIRHPGTVLYQNALSKKCLGDVRGCAGGTFLRWLLLDCDDGRAGEEVTAEAEEAAVAAGAASSHFDPSATTAEAALPPKVAQALSCRQRFSAVVRLPPHQWGQCGGQLTDAIAAIASMGTGTDSVARDRDGDAVWWASTLASSSQVPSQSGSTRALPSGWDGLSRSRSPELDFVDRLLLTALHPVEAAAGCRSGSGSTPQVAVRRAARFTRGASMLGLQQASQRVVAEDNATTTAATAACRVFGRSSAGVIVAASANKNCQFNVQGHSAVCASKATDGGPRPHSDAQGGGASAASDLTMKSCLLTPWFASHTDSLPAMYNPMALSTPDDHTTFRRVVDADADGVDDVTRAQQQQQPCAITRWLQSRPTKPIHTEDDVGQVAVPALLPCPPPQVQALYTGRGLPPSSGCAAAPTAETLRRLLGTASPTASMSRRFTAPRRAASILSSATPAAGVVRAASQGPALTSEKDAVATVQERVGATGGVSTLSRASSMSTKAPASSTPTDFLLTFTTCLKGASSTGESYEDGVGQGTEAEAPQVAIAAVKTADGSTTAPNMQHAVLSSVLLAGAHENGVTAFAAADLKEEGLLAEVGGVAIKAAVTMVTAEAGVAVAPKQQLPALMVTEPQWGSTNVKSVRQCESSHMRHSYDVTAATFEQPKANIPLRYVTSQNELYNMKLPGTLPLPGPIQLSQPTPLQQQQLEASSPCQTRRPLQRANTHARLRQLMSTFQNDWRVPPPHQQVSLSAATPSQQQVPPPQSPPPPSPLQQKQKQHMLQNEQQTTSDQPLSSLSVGNFSSGPSSSRMIRPTSATGNQLHRLFSGSLSRLSTSRDLLTAVNGANTPGKGWTGAVAVPPLLTQSPLSGGVGDGDWTSTSLPHESWLGQGLKDTLTSGGGVGTTTVIDKTNGPSCVSTGRAVWHKVCIQAVEGENLHITAPGPGGTIGSSQTGGGDHTRPGRGNSSATAGQLLVVTHFDVTEYLAEHQPMAKLLQKEHKILESIFPRHCIEYLTTGVGTTSIQSGSEAPVLRPGQRNSIGAGDDKELGLVDGSEPAVMQATRPLPPTISYSVSAARLASLATAHASVTVLFCDVVGFTSMCHSASPFTVMSFLNDLYSRFDSIVDIYKVYKVETIGDCYMVAGGLVAYDEDGYKSVISGTEDPLHAVRIMEFAKAILRVSREVQLPLTGQHVQLRIGLHSGPVTSGVVGDRMPRFCLFGDTVNVASRMESTCRPGCIHVSAATREKLPKEPWRDLGPTAVKGKGFMRTFEWAGDVYGRLQDEQLQRLLGLYL